MGRDGAQREKAKFTVINEKLIKECIYIAPTSTSAEDERKSRGVDKGDRDVKRLAQHQLEFHEVECLMFSFKGIARIDNLVGFDRLTKLQLDNNGITKIENLGHLRTLVWLDLSFNRIKVIEGLEMLTELEDVSLYSNEITVLQGLDSLTKLTCFSIGKNQLEHIEEVAKYLHKFRDLRMLTLAGNAKICSHPSYKSKLLGYISRLKYLDSRLIFADDISHAKEEQREYLSPVDEADRKEEERIKLAKAETDEHDEYERANVPRVHRLIDDLMLMDTEGRSIRALLEVDSVKEKTQEVINQYKEKFSNKARELIDKMKDIRLRKDKDATELNYTLTTAKRLCDEQCKKLIKNFERAKKKLIPPGLQTKPDPEAYDEAAVQQLRDDLMELQSALLEKEADQQDAYEQILKDYDEVLTMFKSEATEGLTNHFDELRLMERQFQLDIKSKFDTWYEDRQQTQNSAEGTGFAPTSDHHSNEPKAVLQILDNKEEYTKILTEWSEMKAKKLDEKEEELKKREGDMAAEINARNISEEHERNRGRVCEIHAYVARMAEEIRRWEQDVDQ